MPTPRKIPDDLWAEIETLIPPAPPRDKGGRPRANDRTLLNGMLYILWTGAPWRAMPAEFGPWQTVYDRFAEWEEAKVFEAMWMCLDAAYHNAPCHKVVMAENYEGHARAEEGSR